MVHDPQNGANWPFYRFSWRNQPIMGAHSVQMASNEKPNMSESLGGNNLTYWPFRMTSGWSMTLKLEPKLTILQVFLEPIASKLPFFGYISIMTAAKTVLTSSGWHVITLGTPGVPYEAILRLWAPTTLAKNNVYYSSMSIGHFVWKFFLQSIILYIKLSAESNKHIRRALKPMLQSKN